MLITATVFAALAGLLHLFIFYVESFAWNSDLARSIFGNQSDEVTQITAFFAFNQGVYNAALAVIAEVGAIFLLVASSPLVGSTLILAGCGSMLVAALALGFISNKHRTAALKQGILPFFAVMFTLPVLI